MKWFGILSGFVFLAKVCYNNTDCTSLAFLG